MRTKFNIEITENVSGHVSSLLEHSDPQSSPIESSSSLSLVQGLQVEVESEAMASTKDVRTASSNEPSPFHLKETGQLGLNYRRLRHTLTYKTEFCIASELMKMVHRVVARETLGMERLASSLVFARPFVPV